LFETFIRHRSVKRVTFWGLDDGKSWLNTWPGKRTNHPLLFDRDRRPKQCFWRVLDVGIGRAD
jgi:endo-1,4-beta-xylanase